MDVVILHREAFGHGGVGCGSRNCLVAGARADAEEVEGLRGMADNVRWAVVVALLGGAIGLFYYFSDQSLLLRVIGLVAAAGIAVAVALQTAKGRLAWSMMGEARMEVRKVVWPTRKETVQTTGIVLVMVTIVALLLWALDGLLGYLMRQLLGHGG
ncbi:MAG: preprotein translocase subunit SecE [Gammaproteobacteria bacterium]